MAEKVNFIRMEDGTKEEYQLLDRLEKQYIQGLPDRLMESLQKLQYSLSGYQVSRLEHSLQSATRAYQAGESDELIVAALIHDIGDELAPHSHSEMAAAILRPFVSDKVYWIVKVHGIFQMYYYAHLTGGDRNARDKYQDHPYYQDAVRFCEHYDQNCFDPNFDSKPLEFFRPLVEKIFLAEPLFDKEYQHRFKTDS